MATPFPMIEDEPLMGETPLERAIAYHDRTKHHFHRYAAGPGYLDWATQPDPFRRFRGAPLTPLPFTTDDVETTYPALYRPDTVAPRPVDMPSLGAFFELALGLSAWKVAGPSRWALRNNPSSGNLHPTEGYLLGRGIPGVRNGIHHYAPLEHALEHRAAADLPLPDGTFLVGLSSIFWREAWKYGERAFRYCNHDAGHAVAAFRYAGAALGWEVTLWDAPGDADVAAILGLDQDADFEEAEHEHPDALLLVRIGTDEQNVDLNALILAARSASWNGSANCLSQSRREWPVIEEAAEATVKPRTDAAPAPDCPASPDVSGEEEIPAVAVIRQRRSAQAYDGRTGLTREAFLRMVDRTAARSGTPFAALPWAPLIHPVLMVHRVQDILPGVYVCVRGAAATDRLRAAMRPEFDWDAVYEAPGVALFRLLIGDARDAARAVSCHQDIASDGAFSLGMLADFRPVLEARGAWWYRRLFWESGLLGQVLYLEAEALGVRGTGIGCYFDDAFHEVLGLDGNEFQSMYHFTVGLPLEDPRLQTHPPYSHLPESRRTT